MSGGLVDPCFLLTPRFLSSVGGSLGLWLGLGLVQLGELVIRGVRWGGKRWTRDPPGGEQQNGRVADKYS